MLTTAQLIAEQVLAQFHDASNSDRTCRILLPGITSNLASQIHKHLLDHGAPSYLVVGEGEPADEARKQLRPIALTAVRIDSFIAIAAPGQLAHIQDSIRGSGGAIRSPAISEEWPWIDGGCEYLRFNGEFLDKLIDKWTTNVEDQIWLRTLILKGIVPAIRASPERSKILFEWILGAFVQTSSKATPNIRDAFLFHCGIPRIQTNIKPDEILRKLCVRIRNLCAKIFAKCQGDDNVRSLLSDRVIELCHGDLVKAAELQQSLDVLLDEAGSRRTSDLGFLTYLKCWGPDPLAFTNWTRLDADTLAKIFEAEDLDSSELTLNSIQCDQAVIAEDLQTIAAHVGDRIVLHIRHNIPEHQFRKHQWAIRTSCRRMKVANTILDQPSGMIEQIIDTETLAGRAKNKLPLRVAITRDGDVEVELKSKIGLHLCGLERPAFVASWPAFDVIDAKPGDGGDDSRDSKLRTDEPQHLYIFHEESIKASLTDANEQEVELVPGPRTGISKTRHKIDPSSDPSGGIVLTAKMGDSTAVICFEVTEVDRGQFTIEDELRTRIASRKFDKGTDHLSEIFSGASRDQYPTLGCINDITRPRIDIGRFMESVDGWKPVLGDVISGPPMACRDLGQIAATCSGFNDKTISGLRVPSGSESILDSYISARATVLEFIRDGLDRGPKIPKHPLYATHPVYQKARSRDAEGHICRYLSAYRKLIDHIKTKAATMSWADSFILCHLDSVVMWSDSDQKLRGSIALMGPWHPLIVAKRFMIQKALSERAERLRDKSTGRTFSSLAHLLKGTSGFNWTIGKDKNSQRLSPMYVAPTDDPGWHIAWRTDIASHFTTETTNGVTAISDRISRLFGLSVQMGATGSNELAVTSLKDYLRAFPSRRSVGIRIPRGYSTKVVLRAIDHFIHDDEMPTSDGALLPGGIRVSLDECLGSNSISRWIDPPLYVYTHGSRMDPGQGIDIELLPPPDAVQFLSHAECREIPRGRSECAVFHQPLCDLKEGASLIHDSVTWDFISRAPDGTTLGDIFTAALADLGRALPEPQAASLEVRLPVTLAAPWVIIPARSIDPAVMVKYVRSGEERGIESRALWDFKFDPTGRNAGHYILSRIPQSFRGAVNGFFNRDDVADDFVTELGRIGIAVGGESLRSGRHALGVVGLLGATRLLMGNYEDGPPPLTCTKTSAGFLLPVDALATLFGQSEDSDSRRTDLLAIQLLIRQNGSITISSCGIESKLVSATFSSSKANAAFEQAGQTEREFRELIAISLRVGGVPERLALLALLRFGLRLCAPAQSCEGWLDLESTVYNAVLNGNYRYESLIYNAVVVSTEGDLVGAAELKNNDNGIWARLTKSDWPGISSSQQIRTIRQDLRALFSAPPDELAAKAPDNPPEPPPTDSATISESPKPDEVSSSKQEQARKHASSPSSAAHPDDQAKALLPSDPVRSKIVDGTNDPVPQGPSLALQKILIGTDEARRRVYFDPQSKSNPLVNCNLMVTGSSGTGKTQLLKYLVCCLRDQEKKTLLLDMKNDFASDDVFCQQAGLRRIFVSFDGLPYNPLIPYPVRHPGTGELFIQPAQHVNGVASVLKQTYKLGAQQEMSVKSAIIECFNEQGIPTQGSVPANGRHRFPDFSQVGERLARANPAAYNRLDPLFSLGLFKPEFSQRGYDQLIIEAAALDLSQIPSDELKNALAQLIVLSAHSYFNAQTHSATIRQVLVFDEAHRVLRSDYMAKLIRECRAYGVAAILSSQYPSDFPADISASMATKIIHGNGRDMERVKCIAQLLGLEDDDPAIPELGRFEAFVDNSQFKHSHVKTMNYPAYLLLNKLATNGAQTRDSLHSIEGLDSQKLSIDVLVRQLSGMGLLSEDESRVNYVGEAE